MMATDLKVGLEVYVITHSVTGFNDLRQVTLSKVDLERNFVEYQEYNDLAKKKINVFVWIDDVIEINTHNKWLFRKAKNLYINYNALIDSNIRVFDALEHLEPEVLRTFDFRKPNNLPRK